MYDIHHYGNMVGFRSRTEAYAQALRARVTPESVVLDIGVGSGILTLLACRAGARKVYAVEPDGIIQVAREAVAANGYANRVEFIQGFSTAVDLPEMVDVIVSDVHGPLPFFRGSLTSIIDARDRFLKPGGFLIPERETVSVAIVSAPASYEGITHSWGNNLGFDFAAARQRAVNCWTDWRTDPSSLVVEPKVWTVLDYRELETANARGHATWTVAQGCDAHGLCMWFDSETAPGCGFSNSPNVDEPNVYRHGFFPWPEARQLEPGDQVTVAVRADAVGQAYLWSWNTEIRGQARRGPSKAQFRQSDFLGTLLTKDTIRKSAESFIPSPNHQASIDKMILDLLFAGISLEEISRRVSDHFPERFPEWRKAFSRVSEMSLRYSL